MASIYNQTNIDIKNRAKKYYAYKGVDCLFKEMVSNAMHSCIISQNKEPLVSVEVVELPSETNILKYKIIIKDNGIGFDNENYENFTILDKENSKKKEYGFQSFGQGRLCLVYFADNTEYVSFYKNEDDVYKREFRYPLLDGDLLCRANSPEKVSNIQNTGTSVTIYVNIEESAKRFKTFFDKYDDIEKLGHWFENTFFPLIQKVPMVLKFKDKEKTIKIENLEKNQINEFTIKADEENYRFTIYTIHSEKESNENIKCFAKGVLCKLAYKEKLRYHLKSNSVFYLTSKYFDERVDLIGEEIKCDKDIFDQIQQNINQTLNSAFKEIIDKNKDKTKKNIELFKNSKPTFRGFLDESHLDLYVNEVTVDEMEKIACKNKIDAENNYWSGIETKYKDELIKTGLFNYFKHREEILKKFKYDFLEHYLNDGQNKTQNENVIHDILFERNKEIYNQDSIDVYFNHNLWLIDDKFSLFKTAQSTVQGQGASDIYLYCDNDNVSEIVIIELKSTHKAHNVKDMIAQVNRYAKEIYDGKSKALAGSITNLKNAKYTGYIIASQENISEAYEHATTETGLQLTKIPFLDASYYFDSPAVPTKIRIELISYKDLYKISTSRNKPIIDLMYKSHTK